MCPSEAASNLDRLSAALRALNARLRVEGNPAGVPFDPRPQLMVQMSSLTLITDLGPLDLCFRLAGFPDGYKSLRPNTVIVSVDDLDVPVAALTDVVTSKRAAGRVTDIVALPEIERHLRRQ